MAGTKDPKATYIDYSARAWSTTADGIFAEAGQVLDRTQNKDQQAINAEVKANLARIEGIAGSAAAGAYVFKGSLNGLDELLLLTNVKVGDVYNIKTEFELASELNPGGAKTKYPAGTNVAATKTMSASTGDGWDALGGVTLDLAPINQKISNLESGKYDANKVVTTSATNDDAHVLTAKATHDVANSAATTAVNTFKTTNFDPLNEQVSVMEANKADVTYVDAELAKKSNNGHGHTVAEISDFSAKVDEKITARVETVGTSSATSDTSFYSCKATNEIATKAATDSLSNFKTTDYELFKQQTSSALDKKIEEGRLEERSRKATEEAKNHANALIVNDKNDKTSTYRVLSAKATHDAIADALDVVAPDVTALTTSVENIKKFVTVPFDGFETGAVNIEEVSCTNVSKIVYVMQKKSFAAKGTDGKFYYSWAPQDDGRNRDLYIEGLNTLTKKLYVYKNEIYSVRGSLGLSLMVGNALMTVDGTDDARSVSQNALRNKFGQYYNKTECNNTFVTQTKFNEFVQKIEGLLKLA